MIAAILLAATQVAAPAELPDLSGVVEEGRPRMAPRPSAPADAAAVEAAIAAWKADPTPATLRALQDFAETGDKAALRAMVRAHVFYAEQWRAEYDKFGAGMLRRPEYVHEALASLWAIQLWNAGEFDREVGREIGKCTHGGVGLADPSRWVKKGRSFAPAMTDEYDCGFNMEGPEKELSDLWFADADEVPYRVKKGALKKVILTERPVRSQAQMEQTRFALAFKPAEDKLDDWKFTDEYIFTLSDPATVKTYWDMRMKRAVQGIAIDYYKPAIENPLNYAMARNPQLRVTYDAAVQTWLRSLSSGSTPAMGFDDPQRFDSRIANGNWHNSDKSWMANVAISTTPERAQQWYSIFGHDLYGMPDRAEWCAAGAQQACGDQQEFLAGIAANNAQNSGSSSGYVFTNSGSGALIQSENAVNAANCARASLGANIGCTTP